MAKAISAHMSGQPTGAAALRLLGDMEAEPVYVEHAIGIKPDFAIAYYVRALAKMRLHKEEEGKKDLQKAAEVAAKIGQQGLHRKAKSELEKLELLQQQNSQ